MRYRVVRVYDVEISQEELAKVPTEHLNDLIDTCTRQYDAGEFKDLYLYKDGDDKLWGDWNDTGGIEEEILVGPIMWSAEEIDVNIE